jgi:signal transduction histidine kinase
MRILQRLNRLQRKVLLVIVAIVLAPMVVTGTLSAAWIAGRMDASIERWIREAEQVNQAALAKLHQNARLFADVLEETTGGHLKLEPAASPIPDRLQPLAKELGINLVQVYGYNNELLYSSGAATLRTSWAHGQDTAVVQVEQDRRNLLAAITIVRVPRRAERHYRLVLGTWFDKELLNRLGRLSGLKTRLFYPRQGDFEKAFSEESRPLRLRLPADALERLRNKADYYTPSAEGGSYRGLYSPLVDTTGRVEAVLFTGLAHREGAELLTDQAALTLAIALGGTVLAVATGLVLSRIVVRPVECLHEGVMRLAAQDYRAAVPIRSDDELGDLARAFNSMAAGLRETRDEQRREFQRDKLTALGELSLAMAHEIRNPIGVINTASKLLETSQDPQRTAKLRRMIREESLRLDHLLKDFQQLARHRRPEPRPIDPVEPLERALEVSLAGREDIRVTRHYLHRELRLPLDAELLRQAWANLVRNALQAMGEGPGELQLRSALEDDTLVVALQDSGPGVPVEIMTRLFEPFFTTKTHGSGLGLTIANTLVEANGGRLELLPGTRQGACFAMRFPLTATEES